MNSEEIQCVAFEIILSSGDARTKIHEAFASMRKKDYEASQKLIDEADKALVTAHSAQTHLLTNYANGEKIEMEIIMVHAQDHLMTTMTLKEVAIEMLHLHKLLP